MLYLEPSGPLNCVCSYVNAPVIIDVEHTPYRSYPSWLHGLSIDYPRGGWGVQWSSSYGTHLRSFCTNSILMECAPNGCTNVVSYFHNFPISVYGEAGMEVSQPTYDSCAQSEKTRKSMKLIDDCMHRMKAPRSCYHESVCQLKVNVV